jgi:Fic family protein
MDSGKFWEGFKFSYLLDNSHLFPQLVAIEAYKQAALNLVLPPDWRNQLDKLNRVRAVHGTTALEGNPLSEAEVSRQIDIVDKKEEKRDQNKPTKEQLQIRNSTKAQEWVKKRFYPGSNPFTVDDILKMHRMITEESDEAHNIPGEFRTFSVTVGSEDMGGVHIGAPHNDLSCLMEKYVSFVNSKKLMDTHPVIRALLAHFFLVTIHPFGDGNGRVSRLLEAGILFQGEYNVHGFYGLSNYFYKNEREYKTTLQESRREQPFNIAPFIEFGFKGFAFELGGINNFIKTKLNRVVYRQMLVHNYNNRMGIRRRLLNQREYALLTFLLSETEPIDPFSDNPSRKIKLSELSQDRYVKALYRSVTSRTFHRELFRLAGPELRFIKFERQAESREWIVELNFEAIAKH